MKVVIQEDKFESGRNRSGLTFAVLAAGAGLFWVLIGGTVPVYGQSARNIILMISDGAGFNSYEAASYYQYGQLGMQVYDTFPVHYGCTTYMLNSGGVPQGYDPDLMWSDFNYAKGNNNYTIFTDSAAAATALNTGVKTTNGRINTDMDGLYLYTFAEYADVFGMSTGAVTSVELSHATPACVWAHNISRNNYSAIANEMVYSSGLDVVLGAGHPDYGPNGEPGSYGYTYVGGVTTWNELITGTTGQGWSFIETKADFEAIAADPNLAPDRLFGVPQVHTTLQYDRSGSGMGNFNTTVPNLVTMAQAALNTLSKNPNGFYLMIEGGAPDWANHGNNVGRMIEEMMDFNHSVEAVVDWVNANSNWDETLLIITSDHETGMLWGEGTYIDTDGDSFFDNGLDQFVDFQHVGNNGAGNLPSVQYGSGGHTNTLTPMFAIGAGSDYFANLVDGVDSIAGQFWGFNNNEYVDNTDIFRVMLHSIVQQPVFMPPDPGRAGEFNTFTVLNVEPGAKVYFVYGLSAGTTSVPGCPGLKLGIKNAALIGSTFADAKGQAELLEFVPGKARGRDILFQAVTVVNCEVSTLMPHQF